MSLLTQFELSRNSDLRNRVVAAGFKAAVAVLAEDTATANHVERAKLALDLLKADPRDTISKQMLRCVADNATIQAAAVGEWADNDIQFVVNAEITPMGVALYG